MKKIMIGIGLMLPVMAQAQTGLSNMPLPQRKTDATQIQQQLQEEPPVFVYVEQMPEFPGDLPGFLSKNLKYPESALHDRIEGKVFLKFIVKEDGSIADTRVMRSLSTDCDNEALRVIGLMPKWKPGKQNGRAVSVYYTLPIVFKLEN